MRVRRLFPHCQIANYSYSTSHGSYSTLTFPGEISSVSVLISANTSSLPVPHSQTAVTKQFLRIKSHLASPALAKSLPLLMSTATFDCSRPRRSPASQLAEYESSSVRNLDHQLCVNVVSHLSQNTEANVPRGGGLRDIRPIVSSEAPAVKYMRCLNDQYSLGTLCILPSNSTAEAMSKP